ncbi:hypothetical protein EYC59_02675 [Candidatus Saccharibacteria bacterium]|nr:MAG: hypothetical protein EYC59_02675 [Candidatus Saccharibacteria bacterium]
MHPVRALGIFLLILLVGGLVTYGVINFGWTAVGLAILVATGASLVMIALLWLITEGPRRFNNGIRRY